MKTVYRVEVQQTFGTADAAQTFVQSFRFVECDRLTVRKVEIRDDEKDEDEACYSKA